MGNNTILYLFTIFIILKVEHFPFGNMFELLYFFEHVENLDPIFSHISFI